MQNTKTNSKHLAQNPLIDSFITSRKLPAKRTHRQCSFWARNELVDRLDQLAQKYGRGFKQWVYNAALERIIDEISE